MGTLSSASDNLRRFVLGSPPWVIFMLSLSIMAVGILLLAYRLRIDPDYRREPTLSGISFCFDPAEEGSGALRPTFVAHEHNVTLPVVLKTSKRFLDYATKNSPSGKLVAVGTFFSGQMGLKGAEGHSHNWSMVLPLDANRSSCEDRNCWTALWESCVILSSDDQGALPNLMKDSELIGCSAGKILRDTDASAPLVVSFLNKRLFAAESTTTAPGGGTVASTRKTGRDGLFCSGGITVKLQLNEKQHFVLIPMVHDTLAARMHLLYTSYFLFITLIVVMCYAVCKGHQFHKGSGGRHLGGAEIEDFANGKF